MIGENMRERQRNRKVQALENNFCKLVQSSSRLGFPRVRELALLDRGQPWCVTRSLHFEANAPHRATLHQSLTTRHSNVPSLEQLPVLICDWLRCTIPSVIGFNILSVLIGRNTPEANLQTLITRTFLATIRARASHHFSTQ